MSRSWYTVREVAELLGVSISKVRLQIELGLLPADVSERPVRPKRKKAYRETRIYPDQLHAYCAEYYPRVVVHRDPAA
jgi:hypothetical protein